MAVHGGDGRVHLVVGDLDEAEALGAAGGAVGRDGGAAATPLGEGGVEIRLGSVEGEVSNEQSLTHGMCNRSFPAQGPGGCGQLPLAVANRGFVGSPVNKKSPPPDRNTGAADLRFRDVLRNQRNLNCSGPTLPQSPPGCKPGNLPPSSMADDRRGPPAAGQAGPGRRAA